MMNAYTGSSLTGRVFPEDAMSSDKIWAAMRKLQAAHSPSRVAIIVVPDQPKFQISSDCPLTPEFRAEMNAWCLSFFGTTNYIPDGQVISSTTDGGKFLYANPRTYANLKATFDKLNQPSVGYDPSAIGWTR